VRLEGVCPDKGQRVAIEEKVVSTLRLLAAHTTYLTESIKWVDMEVLFSEKGMPGDPAN
jgi:hypothetical protein